MVKSGKAQQFDALINPKSVAIIGASRSRKKLGARVLNNLRVAGFRGRVYPVNPQLTSVSGQRVYASIKDIPRRVDLAVVVTPAPTVVEVVKQCGQAGARSCVIISSGFKEVGPEGARAEDEIKRLAKRYRMALLGPNCLGVIHGDHRLNASFSDPLRPGGNVVCVSQSGAMAVALADWARQSDVKLRAIVSLGNKAGLDEVDCIEYFGQDKKTAGILVYLESVERGRELVQAIKRIATRVPVVVLKAGTTSLGQRAAISHTGAMAGSSQVFAAAMREAGAIQVTTLQEFFTQAELVSTGRRPVGTGLAVITNAGGPSIVTADAVAKTVLKLPALSATTIARLRRVVPASASVANPIDLIGDADASRYSKTLNLVLADPAISMALVILTAQVVTEPMATAEAVIRAQRRYPNTFIVTSFMGGPAIAKAAQRLRDAGIPQLAFPDMAAVALARFASSGVSPKHASVKSIIPPKAKWQPAGLMMPQVAARRVAGYGFTVTPTRLVHTIAEAEAAARQLGYPVVLKLASRRVVHKAAGGAVWLDIDTPGHLRRAWRTAQQKFRPPAVWPADEGWLLQPQLKGYDEWFVGAIRDHSFGPVVLVGRGGTKVEKQGTMVTRLAPITKGEAASAIRQTTWGEKESAQLIRVLAEAVGHVSQLMLEHPEVTELDLNPLLIHPKTRQTRLIDARIVVDTSS